MATPVPSPLSAHSAPHSHLLPSSTARQTPALHRIQVQLQMTSEALAPHCGRISSCCDRRLCCARLTPEHPRANVRTHHKTVSAVDFSREHSLSTGPNVCPATTTQPCTEARTHPEEQRRQGKGRSENAELEHGRMWEKEGNKHTIPSRTRGCT